MNNYNNNHWTYLKIEDRISKIENNFLTNLNYIREMLKELKIHNHTNRLKPYISKRKKTKLKGGKTKNGKLQKRS